MEQIPLEQYPNQEFTCVLDDQNCTIRIVQRFNAVFMDLTVGDTVIRQGMLCRPCHPILSTPCNFRGQFYIRDNLASAGNQTNPDWEQFEDRYQLLYITEDEAQELDDYINDWCEANA